MDGGVPETRKETFCCQRPRPHAPPSGDCLFWRSLRFQVTSSLLCKHSSISKQGFTLQLTLTTCSARCRGAKTTETSTNQQTGGAHASPEGIGCWS